MKLSASVPRSKPHSATAVRAMLDALSRAERNDVAAAHFVFDGAAHLNSYSLSVRYV
jgi:hypothetical protein